jgi:hypothetical protein
LVAVAVLVVGGVGLLPGLLPPPGGYSIAALRSMPESRLVVPGASFVRPLTIKGSRGFPFFSESIPPVVGQVVGTPDHLGTVLAFYIARLDALGWRYSGYCDECVGGSGAGEWSRGRLSFSVLVPPMRPRGFQKYTTYYVTNLSA